MDFRLRHRVGRYRWLTAGVVIGMVWCVSSQYETRWRGPGFSVVLTGGSMILYGQGAWHDSDPRFPSLRRRYETSFGIARPEVEGAERDDGIPPDGSPIGWRVRDDYFTLNPPLMWEWRCRVPLLFPFLLTLSVAVYHDLRVPRYARGCCTSCGYDLTGNESSVCPECGEPFDPGMLKA